MNIRILAAAAVAIAVAAPAARAATFMPAAVQATCLSNCFDQTHTYKQTIAASSFSGPVSIGAFSFDRNLLGQDHQTSVFHVTFWTADGRQVGDFGHYMVGSLAGDVLRLKGDSFAYDPSLGNLIMKIELDGYGSGGAGGGGGGFGGGLSSGGFGGSSGSTAFDSGIGIDQVTLAPHGLGSAPTVALLQPVPEPGAWALMLTGFLGAGAVLRTRRRQPARV